MSTAYSQALAKEGDAPTMRPLTDADHANAHLLHNAHKAFQAGDCCATIRIGISVNQDRKVIWGSC